jgi:hypothetical protein
MHLVFSLYWHLPSLTKPEIASVLQHIHCARRWSTGINQKLFPRIYARHSGDTRIRDFVRIRISSLDETRHRASIALVGKWI